MARQLFQYHPTVGYQFIPGLRARMDHESGGYLVRVNDQGFRSEHEFVREKTPGTRRVLLFGDSFTAGDGVRNRDRYGDVLEELIPGLEVYNFGLPGSGTDQQYLIFREWADRFEHDLVIVAVLVENIRRVAARYRLYEDENGRIVARAKPYYTLDPDDELTLHNVPPPKDPILPEDLPPAERQFVDAGGRHEWLRKVVTRIGAKDLVQRLTNYQPLPEYDDPTGPAWRLMRVILVRWLREISRPVLLVPIPIHQYIEGVAKPDLYQARFAEVARAVPTVVLHDPLSDLSRAANRRQFRFPTDVHLTPQGHRQLAESLAPRLCTALCLPGT